MLKTKPTQSNSDADKRRAGKSKKRLTAKTEVRYTVALAGSVANQVQRCAETSDMSISKTIASLVRLGLEGQEARKQEFFKRLKANLSQSDPMQQDQLVDEFRSLILGR